MAEENKHPPTTEEQTPPEMPGKAPKMEQAEIPDVGGGPAPSAKVIDLSAVRSTPVKDAPTERRRFLDMELCQLTRVYYYDLQQYYRILKQRNNLLKEIQKKPSLQETLFVWDEQMVEYGERIIAARRRFLVRLDEIAAEKLARLTGGRDSLQTLYKPNCEEGSFAERLHRNLERDILFGATQSGPHKDDISFLVTGREAKALRGSSGQPPLRRVWQRLT